MQNVSSISLKTVSSLLWRQNGIVLKEKMCVLWTSRKQFLYYESHEERNTRSLGLVTDESV